jgi:hypothetical protein
MAIISKLNKNAGFYSQFFFMVNHFYYAITNNTSYEIESSSWLFTYNLGWCDYFENISFTGINNNSNIIRSHGQTLGNYKLSEYKSAIKMIYKYNETVKNKIHNTKKKLDLINNNYDSIFIRRGDKMCGESKYIKGGEFVKTLLKINPHCKAIFLQTDDYNCFLEIREYLKNINSNINLMTICEEQMIGGVIVNDHNINGLNDLKNGTEAMKPHFQNREYVSDVFDDLTKNIPVTLMTKEQKYNHTLKMIIGIDIVLNSELCICEFSSNVSRFIKLAHKDSNKVYNVLNINEKFDWNITECPSFGEKWNH